MKKFLINIISFFLVVVLAGIFIIFLPATPRAKESLLFSSFEKDSLMEYTSPPRFILLGGSNVGMGINSRLIKDSLHMNPINTGFHAAVGLKFMLDNAEPFIREGDVVVIIPEYHQFYARYGYGREEAMRMVFDVSLSNAGKLSLDQWINALKYIPKYIRSKLRVTSYFYSFASLDPIYTKYAYNTYGDAVIHWDLPKPEHISPFDAAGPYNSKIMQYMADFIQRMEKKRARVYVSYPGLLDTYLHNERVIQIEYEYEKQGFHLLGSPSDYSIPEKMIYDTPYHLTKAGADFRTEALIRNYKKAVREE